MSPSVTARLRVEAERLLWRYVVEVVERFGLCPWARRARANDEICIEVMLDAPDASVAAVALRLASAPATALGMIVLPRPHRSPLALRRLRDQIVAITPNVGIADFHPDALLDLSSPA